MVDVDFSPRSFAHLTVCRKPTAIRFAASSSTVRSDRVAWGQRWLMSLLGIALLSAFCAAMILLQRDPPSTMQRYRGLSARIPPETRPGRTGTLYVDLPPGYTASMYLSPVTGGLGVGWA